MKEIILVPVVHLSKKSIAYVHKVVEKENPDCIAIELDKKRYLALMYGKQGKPTDFLMRGQFLMFVLALLQERLSRRIKLMPGSEMIEAAKIAHKRKLPIALIDQDFPITISKLKKAPVIEKMRLLLFSFLGAYSKKMSIDDMLKDENVVEIVAVLKKKTPKIYDVLVRQRNRHMAKSLKSLPFNKIVAVVGAGHAAGIKKEIENIKWNSDTGSVQQR